MVNKLENWIGKKITLETSGICPREGVLQSFDENGILIDFIFIPWHKIEALILL